MHTAGNLELLSSHVDAGDRPLLANERSHHVAVTARAAPQVQDAKALDPQRERSAAAVELLVDLVRDLVDDVQDARVRPASSRASRRLEVFRRCKNLGAVGQTGTCSGQAATLATAAR